MARVYLGEDPFIPGRRIEVETDSFGDGERCRICDAVRHAGSGGVPEEYLPPEYSKRAVVEAVWADQVGERRRHPDATQPLPAGSGFVAVG